MKVNNVAKDLAYQEMIFNKDRVNTGPHGPFNYPHF